MFRRSKNNGIQKETAPSKQQKFIDACLIILRKKHGQEPFFNTQSSILTKFLGKQRLRGEGHTETKPPESKRSTKEIKVVTHDDITALDGRGTALAFQHQIEKNDPKHRPWLNGFYADTLGMAFHAWSKESKSEKSCFEWADAAGPEFQATMRDIRTVYLTPAQAITFLATTNQNKQLVCNDRVLDTTAFEMQEDGKCIYAMDLSGNLFVTREGPRDSEKPKARLQHPSFLAGERILCAGEIRIHNGKVTYINNSSGHYRPGSFSVSRLVDELNKRGVLAPDCKVNLQGQRHFDDRKDYTVAEFRNVIRVWPGSPLAKLDLSEKKPVSEESNLSALIRLLNNKNYWLTKSHFSSKLPVGVEAMQMELENFDPEKPEKLFEALQKIALSRNGPKNVFYLLFGYNNRDLMTEKLYAIFRKVRRIEDLHCCKEFQELLADRDNYVADIKIKKAR